jgi:hypothetical protein
MSHNDIINVYTNEDLTSIIPLTRVQARIMSRVGKPHILYKVRAQLKLPHARSLLSSIQALVKLKNIRLTILIILLIALRRLYIDVTINLGLSKRVGDVKVFKS